MSYVVRYYLTLRAKAGEPLMFGVVLAGGVHREWNLTVYAEELAAVLPDWRRFAERVRENPSAPLPDHVEQAVRDVFGLPAPDSKPQFYPIGHFFRPTADRRPMLDSATVPVLAAEFLAHLAPACDLIDRQAV